MNITKEGVRSLIEQVAPDTIAEFDCIAPAAWQEYCKLIGNYHAGHWVDCGWSWRIAQDMFTAGVSDRLAYALSYVRDRVEKQEGDRS